MVARRDERIARLALGSANPGGRLKSGDDAPQWIETVALGDIDPDPDQPRRHFDQGKLRELANSLTSVGQLQPVILVRSRERYRLHVGERRWRAAQLAGLTTIRAIVRATPLEARAARIAQIVENEQRDDLTTTELIDAVRGLHADGLKSVEIAAALSKPKSRISELSALAEAPAELLAVADTIGLGLSYQLLLRWRERPSAAHDFLRQMPVDHISRITIATIGETDFGPSLAADDHPDRIGLKKGASPRPPTEPPGTAIETRPDVDRLLARPRAAPTPASTGALLVEHDEHGCGSVVFGLDAPVDHLAVSFGGVTPIVLHKAEVRLLRTVASSAGPA
jgi:ParB family chromosome partitioning protein